MFKNYQIQLFNNIIPKDHLKLGLNIILLYVDIAKLIKMGHIYSLEFLECLLFGFVVIYGCTNHIYQKHIIQFIYVYYIKLQNASNIILCSQAENALFLLNVID